jgi:hypothetical protein
MQNMSKKANRVCKTCQTEYYFCPNCNNVTAADKYKNIFCSKNCRDIFQTVARYSMNHITKAEANAELSKLDLSNLSSFSEQIKTDVKTITYVAPVKSVVVDVVATETNDNVALTVEEEQPVEQPEYTKKIKRAKRIETDLVVESVEE